MMPMNRRAFLQRAGLTLGATVMAGCQSGGVSLPDRRRPNVVFLLADQWRAQAAGFAGDPNAVTPNLNRLASHSFRFTTAVSCCPVCSPYRASLMTGRYPLTHGVFLNDVTLSTDAISIAQAFGAAGYDTAYIGKWHLDGHGRSAYIPADRRQGFEYWKVLECTHDYNRSYYYADSPEKLQWPGYDAFAQTKDACNYLRTHGHDKPFILILSWGPPHDPYQTAPKQHRERFDPARIQLRPNVPAESAAKARADLAGYYAHIATLDECIGQVIETLDETSRTNDTLLVFTSDHGDMLGSHGMTHKQKPYDESILVPLLIRLPTSKPSNAMTIDAPINTPDLMPTLLGLCRVPIPKTVEGSDISATLLEGKKSDNEAALIECPSPFGQWERRNGGREYRGIRTSRYTFVRDLKGPWLLFDNQIDPYQLDNLVNRPVFADLQRKLDRLLTEKLRQTRDEFLTGPDYIRRWNWTVDDNGTVPYWLKDEKSSS
jgi:arylsulfatase A-like enzyme